VFDDPLRTIAIENIEPQIGCGAFPIKREVGDTVVVEADIFKDGHDLLSAVLLYRKAGDSTWSESPMTLFDNDRWRGSFVVSDLGRYQYAIEAWRDEYGSWVQDLVKKHDAGEDVGSDLLEGERIVSRTRDRASGSLKTEIGRWLGGWSALGDQHSRVVAAAAPSTVEMMRSAPDRSRATRSEVVLEVVVDPVWARFGAWYEMFPRSQGTTAGRSATFRDCERRIPEIRDMGFDILYMPPIHPIGITKRKGRNNNPICSPGDPGCPYAIGSPAGGHDAIDPDLGTIEDFDRLVDVCTVHGMRVALDFAVQCSPDHPYVREHPEWFFKRPDGTIKYAENPPKKYQDIYPLDFQCDAYESLWQEMKRVVEFWISHGVRIFRVDNPHTKPLPFWKWLISEIKRSHPDVIFFAEAFTRPKMMKALAKAGFCQSYTYFTWRNTKPELTEYLTELTRTEMREYYRPNFFTNTPDILPFFLQTGGRPAFRIRAVLAATLSPSYGIYNGFELCENRALPGREEYADSEKYEYKVWDWDRPGHIKDLLRTLNRTRNAHPALQRLDNLVFHRADHDDILVYSKATSDRRDAVVVVVNLNPHDTRESLVHVNPWHLGLGDDEPFVVYDVLSGNRWTWRGWTNYVRLDPLVEPAHLLVVERG
jgi:starch synthase (maltosyl-transferring)